jgi:hypothetical protein
LFIKIQVAVSKEERSLFVEQARERLVPVFQDKIRVVECAEDAVQKDVILQ